jgi:chondroitin AC lyase
MFDDEIVCLGNSITAASGQGTYDANTTLNQCNLKGDVIVSENGNSFATLTTKAEHPYTVAPKWVLHDSIGYVFPSGGNVVVSNKTQSGSWSSINNSGSSATVNRDVFSLWFNHGKQVTNGTYAYIIVPGKTATGMQAYFEDGDIEILSNTTNIQAVYHKALGIWGIIFYGAGTFTDGNISVNVSKSCVLLLKKKEDCVEMHIADPAQAQTSITVKTKMPASATETTTVCNFAGTGDYRGASKAYRLPAIPSVGIKELNVKDPAVDLRYYDLMGKEIAKPAVAGIYILKKTHLSKKITTSKEFIITNQ